MFFNLCACGLTASSAGDEFRSGLQRGADARTAITEKPVPQAEAASPQGKKDAAPVTDTDFAYSTAEHASGDIIREYFQIGTHILAFYYDPLQDASREGVITTARGIRLGDSKASVIAAYGQNYTTHDGILSEPIYTFAGEETRAIIRAETATHIHYFSDSRCCITFCFDENDRVSWIIYSDQSVIIG
jgi:hypothetical protein